MTTQPPDWAPWFIGVGLVLILAANLGLPEALAHLWFWWDTRRKK